MRTRQHRDTVCLCCGTPGKYAARGLIWSCYRRHQVAGTVGQFELVGRVAAQRRNPVGLDEIVIPLAVLGVLINEASSEIEEWAESQLGNDVVTLAVNAAESASLSEPSA